MYRQHIVRNVKINMRWIGSLLLYLSVASGLMRAQSIDANLMREVTLARAEIASSAEKLRPYTWTEQIEVSVDGSVKSRGHSAVITTPPANS